MSRVVDTCIVIDVFENDAEFGLRSARLLEARLGKDPSGLRLGKRQTGFLFHRPLQQE